ncbi:MAG TPA: DUF1330 domain-containing protein [Nitrospiraceae bacterium]|nr:DUF1330 domain-containing protein [Nitrospiraceae bacterium]
MSAYAVAIIRETRFGPEIKEYLERIDETLSPYAGKFRVHGGPYYPLEGAWSGDLVMIEFPSLEQATLWYHSSAYRAIKPLRANNTKSVVFLVAGVPDTHKATDILD